MTATAVSLVEEPQPERRSAKQVANNEAQRNSLFWRPALLPIVPTPPWMVLPDYSIVGPEGENLAQDLEVVME
ncbi:MAG: hypothetical protein J7M05_00450 [Anaerolineae bacterium]|nr:hypothetical protein [Anaerolineae bacterium]